MKSRKQVATIDTKKRLGRQKPSASSGKWVAGALSPRWHSPSAGRTNQRVLGPFPAPIQQVDGFALVRFGQHRIEILDPRDFGVGDRQDDVVFTQTGPGRSVSGREHHHPAFELEFFLCASDSSVTDSPICCAAADALGLSSRSAVLPVALSGSMAAMVMPRSRVTPRRNTVTTLLLPGLVAPTRRGRSATFSMVLPSKRVMMSPAS